MIFNKRQALHYPENNQIKPKGKHGRSWISLVDILSFLLFLFFIQQITFLVESIYMLNLLKTQMDIRAMGILFLMLPALVYFLTQSKATYITIVIVMLICIFLSPFFSSALRIFSSGLGAGLFLLYFSLHLSDKNFPKANWGQGVALATLTSIFFRISGKTLDLSITGDTLLFSWILILVSALLFFRIIKDYPYKMSIQEKENHDSGKMDLWLSVPGLAGAVIFIYFVFSSLGVITRWTDADYTTSHVILLVSIFIIVFIGYRKIATFSKVRKLLAVWNVLFLFVFVLNILLHRVSFPSLQNLTPVIVLEGNAISQSMVNYIMLILSPVIFINVSFFIRSITASGSSYLGAPFMGASLFMIVCIFMLIFTNTWGYAGSVSRLFRNQFYLPFAIAGFVMILPYIVVNKRIKALETKHISIKFNTILSLLLVTFSSIILLVGKAKPPLSDPGDTNELILMTYNIQQGVDYWGNKNYKGQLARIQEIDPDILCLQESDAARISGGNSDVVRYFAERLGYYSYYGPKTITGTYGTAILSRLPLDSCRTIFTYSSKDEIGTAVAEISLDSPEITIINSHPAGNEKSRWEHVNLVESLANEAKMVIAMGDYNFKQDSPYYGKMANILKDAWLELYPNATGPVEIEKLDMNFKDRKSSSGKLKENGTLDMTNRIDHIFLSKNFDVLEAHYLPAPESGTDHPLHWVLVKWD